MNCETFSFKSENDADIFVYKWGNEKYAKGVVQIAHGVSEHGGRYEDFARKLVESGYVVYANDHRGHGRTARDTENLIYLPHNGWNLMVKDFYNLTCIIKNQCGSIPLFCFGHSMGSFLVRQYMYQFPYQFKGVILSGTGQFDPILINAGLIIAKRLVERNSGKKRSYYLNKMAFGSFNSKIQNPRTIFDWISRDRSVVDKFTHDPMCGVACTNGLFYEMLKGLKEIQSYKNLSLIPKKTSILLVSGDKDPVGHWGKDVLGLVKVYKKLGIKDIKYNLYKDARHEVINELGRNETISHIIKWLNLHTSTCEKCTKNKDHSCFKL